MIGMCSLSLVVVAPGPITCRNRIRGRCSHRLAFRLKRFWFRPMEMSGYRPKNILWKQFNVIVQEIIHWENKLMKITMKEAVAWQHLSKKSLTLETI